MIKLNLREMLDKKISKIVVEGAMDTTDNNIITRTLNGEVNKGSRFFIVDMSQVSYINSSGMLDLLCCQELLNMHHGSVIFFGIDASMKNVLDVVGISKLISILETEEEGVKSLLVSMDADKTIK